VEVREIFAESIFGQETPSMDRAPASEPVIVDSFGKAVSQIFVGEQILVQSEVTNTQSRKQPFVYILQVKNSEGITESLSWISAQLPPNESLKVAQSWMPSGPDEYTVEIFVWDSLTNLAPLSPVRMKSVSVLS
jgi:hypothetical protein